MNDVSLKLRIEIFNTVISQSDPFGESRDERNLLKFLNQIWNLNSMPSEDPRYDTAQDEVVQHTLNNPDWDYSYLFNNRFKLLGDNKKFILFLEILVSPEFRANEDDITRYILLINPSLRKEGLALGIETFDENGFPIYRIKDVADLEDGLDLPENKIPFFVIKNVKNKSHKIESHEPPKTFPAFVLVFNHGWNDFGHQTAFDLFYYSEEQMGLYIGEVKIMNLSDEVKKALPNKFFTLDENFCSLGESEQYYLQLKSIFNRKFLSVLFAMKDAAFFPDIQDSFESNNIFRRSLLRSDRAERLLREVKYKIYKYDLANLYSFSYEFKPKFSDLSVKVSFDFDGNSTSQNRIYGLIGKNATGKTQLMTLLPSDIAKNNEKVFSPRVPLFSKIIAVSYSVFDSFEKPSRTASFNYIYCGLKDRNGEILSNQGLVLRFHNSWKKIKTFGRMAQWREILLNFIDEEIVSEFVEGDLEDSYTVNLEGFSKVRLLLSSGQSMILYIVTEIVANIRYDSLILYDEPETHLHPNAIIQLINTIYDLVNKFESYCILATHSPLIIRELLSKNVLVIERNGTVSSVRKIGVESFGENLTILTEEVFGTRAIQKNHKVIIQEMIDDGKSFQEIVSSLQSDGLPLSLNVLMLIKSLLNEES